MSDCLYVRIQLECDFFEKEVSEFLFEVVAEGCRRKIAVSFFKDAFVPGKKECVLALADSFNFDLGTPLIGNDLDYEVAEYRPLPLHERLLNLQRLYQFIYDQPIAHSVEAIFTLDFDLDGLPEIEVELDRFADTYEELFRESAKVDSNLPHKMKSIWQKSK